MRTSLFASFWFCYSGLLVSSFGPCQSGCWLVGLGEVVVKGDLKTVGIWYVGVLFVLRVVPALKDLLVDPFFSFQFSGI